MNIPDVLLDQYDALAELYRIDIRGRKGYADKITFELLRLDEEMAKAGES